MKKELIIILIIISIVLIGCKKNVQEADTLAYQEEGEPEQDVLADVQEESEPYQPDVESEPVEQEPKQIEPEQDVLADVQEESEPYQPEPEENEPAPEVLEISKQLTVDKIEFIPDMSISECLAEIKQTNPEMSDQSASDNCYIIEAVKKNDNSLCYELSEDFRDVCLMQVG